MKGSVPENLVSVIPDWLTTSIFSFDLLLSQANLGTTSD